MSVEELRKETYYHYSQRAADIARQLALVGIAVAWIFRTQQKDGSIEVPSLLIISIMLLATGVALDFIRYAYQTAFWAIYCLVIEKKQKDKEEIITHRLRVNIIPNILLWGGFVAVIAGYVFLIIYLFSMLKCC